MALNDLRLSLMTFPQRVTPSTTFSTLDLRLLLLPLGDPTAALDAGWPAFAGTTFKLNACIIDSLASLPTNSAPIALQVPFTAAPPVNAAALFTLLKNNLTAKGVTVNTNAPASPDGVRIKKSLPASYTSAFPFSQPRTNDLLVGDGFGCAIRGQKPNTDPTPPKPVIGWGQILSFALRQPVLAEALGLIYPFSVNVTAPLLKSGGWIYVTLDTTPGANSYTAEWQAAGNFDFLRRYAARIPAIAPTDERTLFAAQLFPVVDVPAGNYDDVQAEAEEYDDGFAKIIHCNQPASIDAATAQADQIAPGAEAGIQIGWDDEQLTVWCNRQLELLRFRLGAPFDANNPEAALGVQGYRVDVRHTVADAWQSLCLVTGALQFNGGTVDATGTTPLPAPSELWIEPTPLRPTPTAGPNTAEAWLPLYFAQWRGNSLVVHDDTTSKLTPGTKPMPGNFLQAFLSSVPVLRYGLDYEFRVRLADLTGGGPKSSDPSTNPALAPIGKCHFVRHIPPKSLVTSQTPVPAAITRGTFLPAVPSQVPVPDPTLAIQTITVQRPRLGYPEAIFAGVSPATFAGASLDALIADAIANHTPLNVPDPDVDRFAITVEARMPAHDSGTAGILPDTTDGLYRVVYRVEMSFNATAADPDPTVTINLDYEDIHQISDLATFTPAGTTITIPTARDIRIRLQALCQPRLNYYADAEPPLGLMTDFIVRKEASAESTLFPVDAVSQVKALYLQPSDNMVQLLAQTLDLKVDNVVFTGMPGTRTVFACSQALRHTLASDYSSITFANQPEFLNHWIVALEFNLDRDWTWDGFAEPAFMIAPTGTTGSPGTVSYPHAISQLALGDLTNPPDRSTVRIIFFDAVEPKPALGDPPAELNPQWNVTCNFPSAPQFVQLYTTRLPITVPPAQTPRIAATGIALSAFQHDSTYSSTDPRQRFLWIEFDEPIADPGDAYFARVLASGPDPLLSVDLIPSPIPEPVPPPLPIDPELIRVISPGESDDAAGLDAMTQLIPADSHVKGLHYLLPLPPGISSEALELFSFWTYEFRAGHKYDLGKDSGGTEHYRWSTAQGRFGAPLIVAGIQHPAPNLVCAVQHTPKAIFVSAPYATTVNNGTRFIDTYFGDPRTEIVVMLYAQVMQIDGESWRNILLTHRVLVPQIPESIPGEFFIRPTPRTRDLIGTTVFSEKQVESILAQLRLSKLTPLSVLAVELLPGDDLGKSDSRNRGNLKSSELQAEYAPTAVADFTGNDALGSDLGNRRILRTSPLTPVPAIC
ncbi:MAG TPA: hypothetical protein VGI45_13400 [Terracidiphilus sp.]|jgi:hypothetical protein